MADEPTASLDAQTGREVIELMQELARSEGCAVLIVTHDPRILDVADRVLTLDDGHLVESDAMFERLLDEVATLHETLTSVLETPGAAEANRPHFDQTAEALNAKVADFVRLHLRPTVAHRADALQQLLGTLRAFESAWWEFVTTCAAAPGELRAGLGDALTQSLGAVMLTAGEALRVRSEENVGTLREVTADRSDLLKRVRDFQLAGSPDAAEERRTAVFALTNGFARAIYLLGQVARFLEECRRPDVK
jgi:ABC-type glutathione transport system ATPase component